MSKKNLPHIPLYIGDWEKDCNVLSLETEAAWLRIIFKMFSKGKQSSIKLTSKALQNLWRVSTEKMNEILKELIDNDISDITIESDSIEFVCRRYVHENSISEVRSIAGSSKGKNKTKTKTKQNKNKIEQNADNDIDNDNNIDINIDNKEVSIFDFKKSMINYGFDLILVDRWMEVRKKLKAVNSDVAFEGFIREVSKSNQDKNYILRKCVEKSWKGFESTWLDNLSKNENNTKSIAI